MERYKGLDLDMRNTRERAEFSLKKTGVQPEFEEVSRAPYEYDLEVK
jgi:hypothetical protein